MDWSKLLEQIMVIINAIIALFAKKEGVEPEAMEARFPKLELLRELRTLLPIPSLDDQAGVWAFVDRVLALAKKYLTGEAAAKMLSIVETLLTNVNFKALVWDLLQKSLADNTEGLVLMAAGQPPAEIDAEVKAISEAEAIDPATIIMIITAAIQIVKMIREWRNNRQ